MEVENAPEVPEGEGRLFLNLLLSPDGTHFCGKHGSRVVHSSKRSHGPRKQSLAGPPVFFLQDCLVELPRNSLPTFTEFGLWEVPTRPNYHIKIVNPAFEPHRPVRFGPGVNLRVVNLCTFLKMNQCLSRGSSVIW